MKKLITFMVIAFLMFSTCYLANAQKVILGFVGDDSTFGDFNNTALEWADETFQTTLIAPKDLEKTDLTKYAVLWWQEGDVDPTGILDDGMIGAIMDYVESGGSLLLSSAAEKFATDFGVESGIPRTYGPGADAQVAGVVILEETADHPVWEGFGGVGEKIQTTSLGFPVSSDYWSNTYNDAIVIGNCWETGTDYAGEVGAFVEWNTNTGNGLVFGMGWRIPHWSDDNDDLETLQKLTTNVINYLASKSLFSAVTPLGNVSATWGEIKSK